MPPPANVRCQIYTPNDPADALAVERCANAGTHWVKWSGCSCLDDRDDDCMDDFYSWECDLHDPQPKEAA
jgi:hypothetical protein